MPRLQHSQIPNISQAISLLLIVFLMMFVIGGLILALDPQAAQGNFSANRLALSIFISMACSYLLLVLISKPYWQSRFIPQLNFNYAWLFGSMTSGLAIAVLVLQLQTLFPAPDTLDTSIGLALSSDPWAKILVIISVILIAPFFEEYLFRGIFFDSLFKQWGLFVATVVSAFIFTLFHLFEYHQYWVAWFSVFCLALLLAFVRYKSQSMLNPIALHATYNTTILLVGSN
ncbi:MAG: CPBP family intramembrane metalloprotease [Gammaproteobacteria bacterium]|nr:CPBP family intramembrane metalloprotease [Gammaproteobacteria bacterium]